jgi:hypothetical protein
MNARHLRCALLLCTLAPFGTNTLHARQFMTREALAAVESCEVIGMVLNKSTYAHAGESYGYYGR